MKERHELGMARGCGCIKEQRGIGCAAGRYRNGAIGLQGKNARREMGFAVNSQDPNSEMLGGGRGRHGQVVLDEKDAHTQVRQIEAEFFFGE
jgi:hypothetical protein